MTQFQHFLKLSIIDYFSILCFKMKREKREEFAISTCFLHLLGCNVGKGVHCTSFLDLFHVGCKFKYLLQLLIIYQVRIHRSLEKNRSQKNKKTVAGAEDGLSGDKEKLRKRVNGLIRRKRMKEVQLLLKKEFGPWGRDTQVKVGILVYA